MQIVPYPTAVNRGVGCEKSYLVGVLHASPEREFSVYAGGFSMVSPGVNSRIKGIDLATEDGVSIVRGEYALTFFTACLLQVLRAHHENNGERYAPKVTGKEKGAYRMR